MNDVTTGNKAEDDALARLRELAKEPPGSPLPDTLRVAEIRQVPEVFQPRGEALDAYHVETLKRALINTGGVLDAVLVMQLGDDAYLIDGHHRLAAYMGAGVANPVPVVVFKGTLEEAILEAGRANSKAKLPMTLEERRNFAWRLVRMGGPSKGGPSKQQMREAAAVSDGLVAEMRRVHGKLGTAADNYPRWLTAQKVAKGEDIDTWNDDDRDAWERERADDLAERLRKAWGPPPRIRVAALALEAYFGGRLSDLRADMRWLAGDDEEEDHGEF
jgi:hypothetical protein